MEGWDVLVPDRCNKAWTLGSGSGSRDIWGALVGDIAPPALAVRQDHTESAYAALCFSSSRIWRENEISSKSIKILIAIIPCPGFTN